MLLVLTCLSLIPSCSTLLQFEIVSLLKIDLLASPVLLLVRGISKLRCQVTATLIGDIIGSQRTDCLAKMQGHISAEITDAIDFASLNIRNV